MLKASSDIENVLFLVVVKNLLFITSFILFFVSCKKKEVPPSNSVKPTATSNPQVGNSYEGGVVAYVLQPGDMGYDPLKVHGLIAAPYDITVCSWGSNVLTYANDTALRYGGASTSAIISVNGQGNYAASLCAGFEYGGHDDWYMPNKQELYKLFINRIKIGGFTNYYYWSSNECGINKAWVLDFGTAYHLQENKSQLCKARPVRSF